MDKLQKIEAS